MARRKWSWTDLQLQRTEHVLHVVEKLKRYWPLTLRQIFYRLVSIPHDVKIYCSKKGCGYQKARLPNTRSSYNQLSKLLKWMRIDEKLPWNVIEDRTRILTSKRGFDNKEEFLTQIRNTLTARRYARCLVQSQPKHIEVWTEKAALLRIFDDVVWPYCIRSVVCRGYDSVTFEADFFVRAGKAISKGLDPVVLYFGDFDPSGVDIFEAAQRTLVDEMGLYGVEFKRIGLNLEHIFTEVNGKLDPNQFLLEKSIDAVKKKDTRYKKFKRRFGEFAVGVELDAIDPAILETMIRDAIEAEIDTRRFEAEKEIEMSEGGVLDGVMDDMKIAFDHVLGKHELYV